jgi:hypothetical protein
MGYLTFSREKYIHRMFQNSVLGIINLSGSGRMMEITGRRKAKKFIIFTKYYYTHQMNQNKRT